MHLALLSMGHGSREHLVTVVAAFNIGIALAHLNNNGVLQNLFEKAQKLLLESMSSSEQIVLHDEVTKEIQAAFNQLVRYIGIQHGMALIRAIEFIEKGVATGEGVEIVDLATSHPPSQNLV